MLKYYYDSTGQETNVKDNSYAKKVISENGTKFYVKTVNGLLYHFTYNNKNSKVQRDDSVFTRVSPACFDLYQRYLKTRNAAALQQAQRNMEL